MNKHRNALKKLDEIVVRGDELLFESIFLKADTTLSTTVIISLISLPPFPYFFFYPIVMGGLSYYMVPFWTISIVHLLII